jgi:hypothetical protein
MGTARKPAPAKLVMAMLATREEWFDRAEGTLQERFGPIDYRSGALPFDHTTYYEAEFGGRLLRRFAAFERLIDPGELAAVKACTNGLEQAWAEAGNRRINLDPGYMSLATFVLATTKDHGHRIYLGQGIYGEVTLTYRDRDWRPWPWTYPDYRSEAYLQILRGIRVLLARQLRAREPTESRPPRAG